MNARRLAVLARELDLGAYLLLGRGEEAQAGREKPSLLADALEAVMAAVFLDGGLEAADALTRRWFTPLLAGLAIRPGRTLRPGCRSLTQARHQGSPTYNLLSESGPSHARVFEVEVCLGNAPWPGARAAPKNRPNKLAAREALDMLQKLTGEEERGGEKTWMNAD